MEIRYFDNVNKVQAQFFKRRGAVRETSKTMKRKKCTSWKCGVTYDRV